MPAPPVHHPQPTDMHTVQHMDLGLGTVSQVALHTKATEMHQRCEGTEVRCPPLID